MPGMEGLLQRILPIVPLLVSLAVHFSLVSFYHFSGPAVIISTVGDPLELAAWMPALTFSHTVLLLVGVWALLDKESVEAVVSYIVAVAFLILLDIVQLGLFFPTIQTHLGHGHDKNSRIWQFSAACVVMNLLFKPISIALASLVLYVRAGGSLGGLGGSRDSYSTVHGSNEHPQE